MSTTLLPQASCPGWQTSRNGSCSASRQAQQTQPAVDQDGSGGSGFGAVLGLSAVGEGVVGGPGGHDASEGEGVAGVARQGSSRSQGCSDLNMECRWKRNGEWFGGWCFSGLCGVVGGKGDEGCKPGVNELVDKETTKEGKRVYEMSRWVHAFTDDELKKEIKPLLKMVIGMIGVRELNGSNRLYEMHLLLNHSQREELENELTSREELAVLQVEFADMEGQMQQLMKELKKSQKNSFFWKSTAIVFGDVA
ncbi:hypothetical protein Tco_0422396 [Tanacetum coccineum]